MNASSVQFTNHIDNTILNFSLNSATLRWNLILHTTFQWLVYHPKIQKISLQITMIISEIQDLFSKIIRFQAIFKGTVGFTRVLLFNFSSQLSTIIKKTGLTAYAAKPAQFLFLYFSSKPAFYHIHQQLSRSLQSERAAVYKHILHTDFHRRALCIMLVEGLTGRICFIDDTLCFVGIHVKGIDTVSQTVIIRSIYVDTDVVLEIPQDIIGTSSYDYARFTLRKIENYFFLGFKNGILHFLMAGPERESHVGKFRCGLLDSLYLLR